MFRFGFGISGLYKLELAFFFCIFGCLYRERYCFSYSLISFCLVLRFALTYCRRVNVPKSVSCYKLDDLVGFFRFAGLYTFITFLVFLLVLLAIFLVLLAVFLVFRDLLTANLNFFKVGY